MRLMGNIYNILAIVGPTACGKTCLAVNLALKLNGEIISGDSRQVYRGMDIGTGKDLGEYRTESGDIAYHLIDIADPSEDYNLYRYVNDFDRCYREITSRKKLPVLCGGSGLYIEAALKGYDLPDIPVDRGLREELEGATRDELAALLKREAQGIYERTDLSSTRRIIRGIEIARHLKEGPAPLSAPRETGYSPLIIGVKFTRQEITERIDARLEGRLKAGMVDEVETLIKTGLPVERLLRLGLEYRYCAMYLENKITYDEMVEKLKTEIHRFAKRQMTWFRGMERRGLPVHWIEGGTPPAALALIERAGGLSCGIS